MSEEFNLRDVMKKEQKKMQDKHKELLEQEKSLSGKIYLPQSIPFGAVLDVTLAKEKIQNAHRRLKEESIVEIEKEDEQMILISEKDLDKIFQEEFGDKLIGVKKDGRG